MDNLKYLESLKKSFEKSSKAERTFVHSLMVNVIIAEELIKFNKQFNAITPQNILQIEDGE